MTVYELVQRLSQYPADMPVFLVAKTFNSVLLYSRAVEVGEMSVVVPSQTLTMVFDGTEITPRGELLIKLQEDDDRAK